MRIVESAREIMLERGYAATTMTDVAARAGVAVQTLYLSCPGGKPALAKAVYDVMLAGDARDEQQRDRPEVQAIIAEPAADRKLVRYAAMAAGIAERIAPVHRVVRAAAHASSVQGAKVLADIEGERLTGSRGLCEHLAAIPALRDGRTTQQAAEQVYALTSIEVYERLTLDCGWSTEQYAEWLARLLVCTLLHPSASTTPDDEPSDRS